MLQHVSSLLFWVIGAAQVMQSKDMKTYVPRFSTCDWCHDMLAERNTKDGPPD